MGTGQAQGPEFRSLTQARFGAWHRVNSLHLHIIPSPDTPPLSHTATTQAEIPREGENNCKTEASVRREA